jgi:hypothetical protein
MKKYITSTLLCLVFLHITYAQVNAYPEIAQICTPDKYLTGSSIYGKNFYFDSKWVKGKLLKADNSIVSNDSFFFNFDKIDRRLLITTDFKKIYEIDRREFKAVLFYWQDSAYTFKHIDFINDKDLFQVIISDKAKYSLFKVMRTTILKAASYYSSSNSPFDRYQDIPEYYIFFPNREYKKIFLLKKAVIERAFNLNPDYQKVEDYLNSTGHKEYEENELIKLILYLNKMAV